MKKTIQIILTSFLFLLAPLSSFSQCEIGNIIAEAHACDANGMFLVDIDFDYANTSDSFTVAGNGNQYGTFAYADLFITVGPLDGDGTTVYEFVITDQDFPDCSNWTTIDPVDCSGAVCELSNLVVDTGACNPDGTYEVVIDFDYQNVTGVGFDLYANGSFFGFYSYDDLPLTIPNFPPSGNMFDVIEVCENDNSNCCTAEEFLAPICTADCEIWDLIVEAHDCDTNGMFLVDLDFNFQNTSDSFMILGNGNNYGTFAYADLWLTIGPFDGDGITNYEFVIVDVDDPNCTADYNLGIINCSGDCAIFDLSVDFQECNPDGTYNMLVNFGYENSPDDFDIFINNSYFGFYENVTLPLLLENITPSGNANDLIKVCSNDNSDCCATLEYDSPNCAPICEIWDLVVEAHDCDSSGMFLVDLDFNYANTSDSFTVVGNGTNYGTFAYSELFITLGPLPGDGSTNWEFIVTDVEHPDCHAVTGLDPINCSSDCEIWDLVVEPHDCDSSGMFLVDLDFNYANTSDSFTVVGNGTNYGTFAYSELYITLGPLPGDGSTNWEFIVTDVEHPDCHAVTGLDPINCSSDCEIWDLVVEPHDCDSSGMFLVDLDFNYANTSDSFTVVGNGTNYGTFAYSELFITLGPLPGDGTTTWEFIVTDQDHPDCSADVGLDPINCSNDCEIWELIVEAHDCDADGMFLVDLDFNYANTSDSFMVVGNGNNYGNFAYSDLFITLGPFPGDGSTAYEFAVIDLNDPNCGAEYNLGVINCGSDCQIFELETDFQGCNADGTYNMLINFAYQNSPDDFDVFINGSFFGFYENVTLPLLLEHITPSGNNNDLLEVCANDNPNCCAALEYDSPNCSNVCEIWDLVVEPHDCDSNGMFLVDLDFNYQNTSDSFTVVGNGNNYGTFAYSDLIITLGPLPGDGTTTWEFIVTDQDHPDCSADVGLDPVNCSSNCEIWDLVVEAHDCNADGMFLVDLDFNYANTSDSFMVVGNGNNYGNFAYSDLYITLGPFVGDGSIAYEFAVIDLEDPNCGAEFNLGVVNCSSDCQIFELEADFQGCNPDGTYNMLINFGYQNSPDDFDIFINGSFFGFYENVTLPLLLENITPSGNNNDLLEVCSNDNPNCCALLEYDSPNCSNVCEIWDLVVEAHDCDANGMFLVDLDFNYVNTSDSFTVVGNGNNYGTFAYSDLYITLGPLPGDGTTTWEFIVTDVEHPDCSAFTGLDPVNCSSDCHVFDLVTDVEGCNPDGTYNMFINFEYQNSPDDFDITINGEYFGFFENVNLPLLLENITPSGNPNDVIQVCANDQPDCCDVLEYDAPDCSTNCEIWDLIVETHDCNDDGMFLVDIDFNYQNTSDSFMILGNGNNYGTFAYSDLWLTIGPFVGDGSIFYEFVIVDVEHPDCHAGIELGPIDCSTDCLISDLEVETMDCNPDGTYELLLDFNFQNVDGVGFDVFANGNFFGFYSYSDLPITIEEFPASGGAWDFLQVCENDNPNCCASIEFEAPNCGGNCLTFNDLPTNHSYGYPDIDPNELAFTTQGVPVKVQEFIYNNAIHFGNVMVYDDLGALGTFNNADGNFLYPYLINMEYNFLQLPGAVIHLEFDFWDVGGGVNIAANDAPVIEANSLFDLDGTMIAPNVSLTIVPDPVHPNEGKAILDGFIGLLTIGGMDGFAIDNMCYEYDQLGDVWPGDTDYDNIANNFDLLMIGVGYGTDGPSRPDASLEWFAQPADDWVESFENGTNFKHADTNGDGVINSDDQLAIHENYGQEHGPVAPFTPIFSTVDDPPLFVEIPDPANIPFGVPFDLPIVLGTTDIPVDEIYGLAFTIEFDPQIFDESAMEVIFHDSWFNENGGVEQLNIQRTADDGRIAVALTRINHQNIEGFGPIATLQVIIDDLGGYTGFSLDIVEVKAITRNEVRVPLHTPNEFVEVPVSAELTTLEQGLSIYPNPTSDFFIIQNENAAAMQQVRLVNMLGQQVGIYESVGNDTNQLDVNHLPSGIYLVEIKFDQQVVTKKIEVFRE